MPGERDRDKGNQPRGDQRGQQEIARGMQYLRPIGKDKGEVDVRRGLFSHACKRRQNYLFGLSLDHLEGGRSLDLLLRDNPPEDRVSRMPSRM